MMSKRMMLIAILIVMLSASVFPGAAGCPDRDKIAKINKMEKTYRENYLSWDAKKREDYQKKKADLIFELAYKGGFDVKSLKHKAKKVPAGAGEEGGAAGTAGHSH